MNMMRPPAFCFYGLRFILPLILLFASAVSSAYAQRRFPHLFDLDSRSADTLASPDATSVRHRYRVTAWGTYSMWEDTINSSVDPVWIYSFPDEEWAKPEWRIFAEGYPIYVGDSRMFDSHGLRVNDRPFPLLPLNTVDHRYSMIISGNGEPVTTSIVDWNFRGLNKQDAHDNNSGWLHVLVEELPLTEMEVCAIDSSRFPVIRVSLKVLRDSVLFEDLAGRLQLSENGVPVQIDSIDCSERVRPVSVGMVFDRSGSMREAWGGSTRMEEVKSAGRKFVDRLAETDEAAVYSFSNNVTLDQTWTSVKSSLRGAIDRLNPEGYTAMNDAVVRALNDIRLRPESYRKALVVLSDGEDNFSSVRNISDVIALAKEVNVPVFAIGLLLDNDDSLRALARETGGGYFSVRDASAIDSVFNSIAEKLFEKGCCNVWYRSPRASADGTWRPVAASISFEADTTVAIDDGYRAPSSTSGVEDERSGGDIAVSIRPNPAAGAAMLDIRSRISCEATISVVNLLGERVIEMHAQRIEGVERLLIPTQSLPIGRYFVRVELAGRMLVERLDVVR